MGVGKFHFCFHGTPSGGQRTLHSDSQARTDSAARAARNPVEEVAGGSGTVSVRAEDEGAVGRAGAWGRPAPSRNLSRGCLLYTSPSPRDTI